LNQLTHRCRHPARRIPAERRAGLPKLKGGLWHPYRRKWATERKHLPLKDVAAAGGWQDVETLLECYQQPDYETLKSVMDGARTLHGAPNGLGGTRGRVRKPAQPGVSIANLL